jgi:hypothetical protein
MVFLLSEEFGQSGLPYALPVKLCACTSSLSSNPSIIGYETNISLNQHRKGFSSHNAVTTPYQRRLERLIRVVKFCGNGEAVLLWGVSGTV